MVGTSTELRLSSTSNYLQLPNEPIELPREVKDFLRQHQIDDRIETPDELRDLMQTLNQTGGDMNGLPRPNFQNLGNMTGQDLTQMLVDWIQSGGPEANMKITRPAPIGNLSSASNYSAQPTSWSGSGSTTTAASTAPTGTTGSTPVSTPAGGAAEPTGGPTGASEARGKTFTSKEDQTAAFIDGQVEGGNGDEMVAAGEEHNVDPLVLAALTQHEANGGDSLEGPTMIDELESPQNAIGDDARMFARLRQQGGASADDPIAEQLRAVNSARGTNQDNWLQGVQDSYQDLEPAAKAFRKDHPVLDTNTVQGAAQALLDSPNVSFWDELSTGSDESVLEQLARTGKADVPVTGETIVPKLEMMQALVEMANQGPIMINALTGGTHSDGSNHYSGTAVDLDVGVGDPAQIEAVAGQFGGVRNYETSHIHIDF